MADNDRIKSRQYSRLRHLKDVDLANPDNNDLLVYDLATDKYILKAAAELGLGGISDVVSDTTPQLGGDLDLNGNLVGDASAADLTKLSEITATSTELNYADGVTSNIQTQLDGKAATVHTHVAADVTDFDTEVANNSSVAANTAKVSADGSVVTHSDITDAGSGAIITSAERTKLSLFWGGFNRLDATAAPTTSDDASNTSGNGTFSVGSIWIDLTNDESYRCVDSTATSAVWVNTSLESADLSTVAITGDSSDLNNDAGFISNVVEDTTPQLGANLDLNTFLVGDASAADLTKLSQLTATSGELNFVDGVTSNIQTQLDGKSPTVHTHVASDVTDFDTEVANNTTVAANTSKLAGIESGATADQTPAEILTAIKTVDGAASGLDADLLDGNEASAFATSSHTHVAADVTDFDAEVANNITVAANTSKLSGIESGATADQTAAEILTAIKTVDGAASGLDADLLDGQEASAFAGASHTHTEADITDLKDYVEGQSINANINVSATGLVASFAQGSNATASGTSGSFAQGLNATASRPQGSFAQGVNAIAFGDSGSFAQGTDVTAAKMASFAQGFNSSATGFGSFAQNSYGGLYGATGAAIASGKYGSFAQGGGYYGASTLASGSKGSFAQGYNASATGANGSFAQGERATAFGEASVARGKGFNGAGRNIQSTGKASFAMGSATNANNGGVTASGDFSFALGNKATANGANGSFAQGTSATASGSNGSFAQGRNTTASGFAGCFSQGHNVYALGNYGCFAQGNYATADGQNGCFAQGGQGGYPVVANGGVGNFASGVKATASGFNGSFAMGYGVTNTSGNGAFAIGNTVLVSAEGAFAQGTSASATATGAIQFGTGTNSVANTLRVGSGPRLDNTTPTEGQVLTTDANNIITGSTNIAIATGANGDITIAPSGTGNVILGNFEFDADQVVGVGTDNYVLTYDSTSGTIQLEAAAGGGGDVLSDTTPQLGGNLDVNGNKIVSVANGDIDIEPNGTGNVILGNFEFDADQAPGVGTDGYVLTYDNGTGEITLTAVPSISTSGIPGQGINSNVSVSSTGTIASMAQGNTATASGAEGSFAQGNSVLASGNRGSFAQGLTASATAGPGAFAQGQIATAMGGPYGVFAQGRNVIANGGHGSFVSGYASRATGSKGTFAQGRSVSATGTSGSFAQGYLTQARGSQGSFAQGVSSTAIGANGSFAQGAQATAAGSRGCFAQGTASKSWGVNGAFAQGWGATASGDTGSFSQGYFTTATGNNGAFAQGNNTVAQGEGSFARGVGFAAGVNRKIVASGKASFSQGSATNVDNEGTLASGDFSFAFGNNATASALESGQFGEGENARATSFKVGLGPSLCGIDGVVNFPVRSADPVSPVDGDMWVKNTGGVRTINVRMAGVTYSMTLT